MNTRETFSADPRPLAFAFTDSFGGTVQVVYDHLPMFQHLSSIFLNQAFVSEERFRERFEESGLKYSEEWLRSEYQLLLEARMVEADKLIDLAWQHFMAHLIESLSATLGDLAEEAGIKAIQAHYAEHQEATFWDLKKPDGGIFSPGEMIQAVHARRTQRINERLGVTAQKRRSRKVSWRQIQLLIEQGLLSQEEIAAHLATSLSDPGISVRTVQRAFKHAFPGRRWKKVIEEIRSSLAG